jgi:hypothetical protein
VEPVELLHIYNQRIWHDPVYIVGTKTALERLKNAIENAIASGEGKKEAEAFFWCNDGEGYNVIVKQDNSDWRNGNWAKRAVPYKDEIAAEKRNDALQPYED